MVLQRLSAIPMLAIMCNGSPARVLQWSGPNGICWFHHGNGHGQYGRAHCGPRHV